MALHSARMAACMSGSTTGRELWLSPAQPRLVACPCRFLERAACWLARPLHSSKHRDSSGSGPIAECAGPFRDRDDQDSNPSLTVKVTKFRPGRVSQALRTSARHHQPSRSTEPPIALRGSNWTVLKERMNDNRIPRGLNNREFGFAYLTDERLGKGIPERVAAATRRWIAGGPGTSPAIG